MQFWGSSPQAPISRNQALPQQLNSARAAASGRCRGRPRCMQQLPSTTDHSNNHSSNMLPAKQPSPIGERAAMEAKAFPSCWVIPRTRPKHRLLAVQYTRLLEAICLAPTLALLHDTIETPSTATGKPCPQPRCVSKCCLAREHPDCC